MGTRLKKSDQVKIRAYEILRDKLMCREEAERIGQFTFSVVQREPGDRYAVLLVIWPEGMYTNHGGPERNMPDDIRYNEPEIYKSSEGYLDYRSLDEKILACLEKAFPVVVASE